MRFKSFSLIELLVVVAIIAVLASIAIPAYKYYWRRAQLSNILNTMSGLKEQVFVYADKNGQFPNK